MDVEHCGAPDKAEDWLLVEAVLNQIDYPGLTAILASYHDGRSGKPTNPCVGFRRQANCVVTGKPIYVQAFANVTYCETEEQIVGACWRCIQEMELHEAAEQFKYKGEKIYDPHAPRPMNLTYSPLTHYKKLEIPDLSIPASFIEPVREK